MTDTYAALIIWGWPSSYAILINAYSEAFSSLEVLGEQPFLKQNSPLKIPEIKSLPLYVKAGTSVALPVDQDMTLRKCLLECRMIGQPCPTAADYASDGTE
ncbi:hypothetical protein [Paenibacillus sp. TC-CSREp1]|uniref:hypothetical protein n=1 Tax=Paenibacillus sp. TC-CSREp1 TaxID=3410089 RepID=UPI003D059243